MQEQHSCKAHSVPKKVPLFVMVDEGDFLLLLSVIVPAQPHKLMLCAAPGANIAELRCC